jgi:two-component system phosphate regulon sensor histidine kinase PhoR
VRFGLFSKLFALFALIVVVAMLIATVAVQKEWERSFDQQLRTGLIEKIRGLRQSLPEITGCDPQPADKLAEITRIVKQQASAMNVRVTVIDRCGKVLADSEADPASMENHATRPEFQASLDRGEIGFDTRTSRTLHWPLLYLAVPSRGGERSGALRVAYPTIEIQNQSRRIRNQIWLASGLALAVALILAALSARWISARSQRIVDFANRVAAGDFQARVHESSVDEFSQVAQALNVTAQQLEDSFGQIKESRERLEALLNSMHEPVLAVSGDRRLQWFNSQMEKLAKQPLRIGAALVESVRDPELVRAIRHTLETREISSARSEMIDRGRVFRVTAAPLGEKGAVAVLTEITEIEKTEKVRRDFIANVSHELRTPLTSIQGYTESLLENAPPSEQREFLDIIRKNAKRMTRLTEDLLTLARVESGEDALRLRAVFPSVVLNDAYESFKDLAKVSGRALVVQNDSEHPIKCDLDKIHQVMANLIENSLKYSIPGGKVTIGATDTENGVRFYVQDEGSGISSEHLSRLFERFYRVDKSRSLESGGTGLGLAIAKHIVLKHSGSIYVQSELGRGSTFSFILPFQDESHDPVFTED